MGGVEPHGGVDEADSPALGMEHVEVGLLHLRRRQLIGGV
eukprot:COSAG04_NODE_26529_length_293_cov_2.376289_1_plen_39_part_01